MNGELAYLTLFVVVFAVNLLPAFGPPTWSIIVLYGLNSDLPAPAIVVVGAVAAASGRLALAHGFRLLGHKVSQKTKRNLAAARAAFERRKASGILALALFALSPVPSAQLFAAVGLAQVRLLPFTLAFFSGRLVSYSIYAGLVKTFENTILGAGFAEHLSGPAGIVLQLLMIAGLVALARIDWERVFGPPPGPEGEGKE